MYCLIRGKAVAGVICQPFVEDGKGRVVWGLRGMGVFGCKPPAERGGAGLVVCTTRAHLTPEAERSVQQLHPTTVLRVGGAGYKSVISQASLDLLPQSIVGIGGTCGCVCICFSRHQEVGHMCT